MKKTLFTVVLLAGMIFSVSAFDNFAQAIIAGDKALANNNKDKAAKCYAEAASMLGMSPELKSIIAKLKKIGKLQEVADIYKRLGKTKSYYYHLYHYSCQAMARKGTLNIDDAIATFTKASEKNQLFLEKKWYWMMKNKDYEKISKDASPIMNDTKRKPAVRSAALYAVQMSLILQKKRIEALKLGDKFLSDPTLNGMNRMKILQTKAIILLVLKRYKEMANAYAEGAKCKVNPIYKIDCLVRQAKCTKTYLKNTEEYCKLVEAAHKLKPKFVEARFSRAWKEVEKIKADKKASRAQNSQNDAEEDDIDK